MAETYCSSFCNQAHRLSDGKPLDHECFVLPTEMLYAERDGDYIKASQILTSWKKRRVHKGVRTRLEVTSSDADFLAQPGLR